MCHIVYRESHFERVLVAFLFVTVDKESGEELFDEVDTNLVNTNVREEDDEQITRAKILLLNVFDFIGILADQINQMKICSKKLCYIELESRGFQDTPNIFLFGYEEFNFKIITESTKI